MQGSKRQPGQFAERVSDLLAHVTYRVARTWREKEAIYRQRYDAYLREGAIEPIDDGLFTDEYDRTDNVQIIGLYVDGALSASMRIHHTTTGAHDMPAMWAFRDHVGPELARGRSIVDPSRFVVSYDASRRYPELVYLTARTGWIAGAHYDADLVLSTARTEHQAFYRRVFGYRLVCGCRAYGTLKKPLSLLFLDYKVQRSIVESRYPFFRSTPEERETIFGARKPTPGPYLAPPSRSADRQTCYA